MGRQRVTMVRAGSTALLLVVLGLSSQLASVHAQRKFPESEPPFPPGWSLVTGAEGWSLASLTEVTVTIAIQPRNIDQLEKAFWQVSDPPPQSMVSIGHWKKFH